MLLRHLKQRGNVFHYQFVSHSGSTVVSDELSKFSKLASDWWNAEGEMKTLHQINPVRVRYIRNRIESKFSQCLPLKELEIVDIGCGGGLLSESLARLGGNVTGLDAGEEVIEIAKLHANSIRGFRRPEYVCGAVEEFSRAKEGQFDVVCALEVIEHVEQVPLFIDSLGRLAKPGGSIFISSINKTLISYFLTIVMAEYVLRWVPRGTHDWNRYISPEEVAAHLRRNAIELKDVAGLVFDPLSPDSWTLNKDHTAANYIMHAVKPSVE